MSLVISFVTLVSVYFRVYITSGYIVDIMCRITG